MVRAESGVVGGLGWSRDGRSFYFANQSETNVTVFRVAITDRKVERIGALKDLRLVNGANGYWAGLGADDAPLFLRDIGTQDIYALDWEAP